MPTIRPAIKFSVVTISFDACHALGQTIASVNDQTHPQIEHVIVDGGSSDGTVEAITKSARRDVRWVSESDRGIADAFNKGAALATGDYLCYLNAGDLFAAPDTLARTADAIARCRPDGDVIYYGDFFSFREGVRFRHTAAAGLADFAWLNPINHQSAFIPRSLARRLPYDRRLRLGMDYDFWLRARNEATFQKLDFPVAVFASDGRSSSAAWAIHNLVVRRLLWHVNLGIRVEAADVARLGWRAGKLKLLALGRAVLGKRLMAFIRRRRAHATIPGGSAAPGASPAMMGRKADVSLNHP